DGDAVDRGLGLGAQLLGDRGGARVLGGDLLPLLGDHEGGVGGHRVAGGLVLVGPAQREVGDQDDRVDALLGRGAIQLDDDVVLLTTLLARGDVDGLGGGLGAVLDELVTHLDRGGADVAGLRGVGVAHGAVAGLDGGDQTVGDVGGLAAWDRPRLDRVVGRGVGGVVGVVLGEVLGGAGVLRAVHRDDGRVGQLDVGVELRDRRV